MVTRRDYVEHDQTLDLLDYVERISNNRLAKIEILAKPNTLRPFGRLLKHRQENCGF